MIEDVNIISDLKDEADPGVLTYLANQRTRVGLTAICDIVRWGSEQSLILPHAQSRTHAKRLTFSIPARTEEVLPCAL